MGGGSDGEEAVGDVAEEGVLVGGVEGALGVAVEFGIFGKDGGGGLVVGVGGVGGGKRLSATSAANASIGGGGAPGEEFPDDDAGGLIERVGEENLGDGGDGEAENGADDDGGGGADDGVDDEAADDVENAARKDDAEDGDGGTDALSGGAGSKGGASKETDATEDVADAFEGVVGGLGGGDGNIGKNELHAGGFERGLVGGSFAKGDGVLAVGGGGEAGILVVGDGSGGGGGEGVQNFVDGGFVAFTGFHFADVFHETHEIIDGLIDFVGSDGARNHIGDSEDGAGAVGNARDLAGDAVEEAGGLRLGFGARTAARGGGIDAVARVGFENGIAVVVVAGAIVVGLLTEAAESGGVAIELVAHGVAVILGVNFGVAGLPVIIEDITTEAEFLVDAVGDRVEKGGDAAAFGVGVGFAEVEVFLVDVSETIGGDVDDFVGGGVVIFEGEVGAGAFNIDAVFGETAAEFVGEMVVFLDASPVGGDWVIAFKHVLGEAAVAEAVAGVLGVGGFGEEGFEGGGEEGVGADEENAAADGENEGDDKGGETALAFAGALDDDGTTSAGIKRGGSAKSGLFGATKIVSGGRH